MMDHKPWNNRDSHRDGFSSRREWGSDRSDRSDRRFGDERPRQSRDDRFGGDRPHYNREERFDDGNRRFGGDRPQYGNRRFGEDRPQRFSRGGDHYSQRTGPRARAYGEGRYDRNEEWSKKQVVRIDSEVAAFFPTAKDVNDALRLVIALTRKVRERAEEAREEAAEQAAAEQRQPEDGEASGEYDAEGEDIPGDEDLDETVTGEDAPADEEEPGRKPAE